MLRSLTKSIKTFNRAPFFKFASGGKKVNSIEEAISHVK